MKFAVVIPTRTASNLTVCVASIRDAEPELPCNHIIVVDDDETGEVLEVCDAFGLTCLDGVKPFVFSRNANIGLEFAYQHVDYAVLHNDDALLQTNHGFSFLALEASLHDGIGVIAPVTNVTGQPLQMPRAVGLRIVPHIAFVSVLIPKRTVEEIGLLDQRYSIDYGVEDRDYCESVNRAGMKVCVHDACFVDHSKLTSSFRGDPRTPKSFRQNWALFQEKWGPTAL